MIEPTEAMFSGMDGQEGIPMQVREMQDGPLHDHSETGDGIDAAIAMILRTAHDRDAAIAHARYVLRELQQFEANLHWIE